MIKQKLCYSLTLACAALAAESYSALSLDQGWHRFNTGCIQAAVLAVIGWVFLGLGAKSITQKAGSLKPYVIAGLIVWLASLLAFRYAYSIVESVFISAILPILVVAFMSYAVGFLSRLGKKESTERNSVDSKKPSKVHHA